MGSSLSQGKPRPAVHVENGHETALRDGNSFSMHMEISALAPAGVAFLRFTTGAKAIEFETAVFNVNQEDVVFEVFDDTTFSVPGSPALYAIQNNRMKKAKATTITFYDGATVDAIGDQVMHDRVIGIAGQSTTKPGFGSGASEDTIVLAPNTEHVFRITNNSIAATDVESHIFYREVNPEEFK